MLGFWRIRFPFLYSRGDDKGFLFFYSNGSNISTDFKDLFVSKIVILAFFSVVSNSKVNLSDLGSVRSISILVTLNFGLVLSSLLMDI
jgi:hypothetical protein